MKRSLIACGFALSLCVAPLVQAGPADEVKTGLGTARENLVAMLDAPDAASQDKFYVAVTQASAEVDKALAALKSGAAADQQAKVQDLQTTWEAFKTTREKEIVPAIRSGKKDEAKAIAKGIQAERMGKMKNLLAELGAK